MSNQLIKWAAIGAGAWILYRYYSKPKNEKPSEPVQKESEREVYSPWWTESQPY